MRHYILARLRVNLSVVAVFFAMSLPPSRLLADNDSSPWDMQSLGAPPATEPADTFGATDVQAVFFAGEPWQGKPTKVFAYYGLPAGASLNSRGTIRVAQAARLLHALRAGLPTPHARVAATVGRTDVYWLLRSPPPTVAATH